MKLSISRIKIDNLAYKALIVGVLLAPLLSYRIPISSLVTVSFTKIAITIATFFFLLKVLFNLKIKVHPLLKENILVFIFFIVINLVIMVKTMNIAFSLKMLFLMTTVYIFAILIAYYFDTIDKLNSLLKTILFSSIVISVFTLWQAFSFYVFGELPELPFIDLFPLPHEDSNLHRTFIWYIPGLVPRLFGTLSEPNSLGIFLAITIVISLFIAVNKKRIFDNKLHKISLINLYISVIPLLLTFSRSGWLTTILGVFLVYSYSKKSKNNSIAIAIGLFMLILVLIVLNYLEISDVYLQRISISEMDSHINVRLNAIKNYFFENPILGIGFGNYGILHGSSFGVSSTHSYYITYLVEGGIMGFFGFIIFVFHLMYIAMLKKKSKEIYYDKLSLIIVIMILFNNIFYHTFWLEITWVALGFCLACTNVKQPQRNVIIKSQMP